MSARFEAARLALRRTGSRLPEPVKRALRVFSGNSQGAAVLALPGWDHPLVGETSTLLTWPPRASPPPPPPKPRVETMLRCLLLTESLDVSGMDEFVAFLARRLPEEGVLAAVLLDAESEGWREGRLAAALRTEGVEVFSATSADGARTISEWAPDIVYSHSAAQWPLRAARDLGIPAMETLHGMHNVYDRTPSQLAERRSQLDRIVAVSDLVRDQYLERDPGAPTDAVITIPNGINASRATTVDRTSARAALGLTDEFLFIALARHAVQKNTFGLADAFLEFAAVEEHAHLVICGRADDVAYTEQVIGLRARAKARSRLHLRDHTDRIDVLLAAADAMVLDSFFEGWSLASMEALGAGLPVILSDVGGAREQLAGGPMKGILISNPLGDPLRVDWVEMASARFRPQINRQELIGALAAFTRGDVELATPEEIRADSLARFSDDLCLHRHAAALIEVARGAIRAE